MTSHAAESKKKWRDSHKDYYREYSASRKEITKEYNRIYRETHKEKIAANKHEYYLSHKEQELARSKAFQENNQEHLRKYRRDNKEKFCEYVYRSRAKYPEKYRANWTVRNALKAGTLIKDVCEVCGSFKSEAHHDNYSQPLMVKWLCRNHHVQLHMIIDNGKKD